MNFRQLEYVVEVNRCGSINRAAQALFISQPALSSSIKKLELELGVRLFERRGRHIELNTYGEIFQNSFLNLFQSVMVFVKHLLCLFQIQIVLAFFCPWNIKYPVQIIADDG